MNNGAVEQSARKETDQEKWYVADMDYIRAEVSSKEEAMKWCTATCDDGRKNPVFRRSRKEHNDFYDYRGPRPKCEELYLGTRRAMIRNGFGDHLKEWDEDRQVERKKS